MNNKMTNHLIDVRARALLTVRLTARSDLSVSELSQDSGFDFLVRVLKNGLVSNRMFGIVLKASVREYDAYSIALKREVIANYKDVPFPICLFFFYMDTDKGFYKWLVEPRLSTMGKPELGVSVKHSQSDTNNAFINPDDLIELNADTLDKLVGTVDSWYDARQ
ncbi:MAG: DUF4365 domain-containing protein [Fibrella sp.]|nr:DUF4365 domain-containing protein [Armatimonadota bacterium]